MIKKLNKKMILGAGIIGAGLYFLTRSAEIQEKAGSGGALGGKDIEGEELGYDYGGYPIDTPYTGEETQEPMQPLETFDTQTADEPSYTTTDTGTRQIGSTAPVTFGEYTGTATKLTEREKCF